jgi:hypothetical protein
VYKEWEEPGNKAKSNPGCIGDFLRSFQHGAAELFCTQGFIPCTHQGVFAAVNLSLWLMFMDLPLTWIWAVY